MKASEKVHLVAGAGAELTRGRRGTWRDSAACGRTSSADPYGQDALVTEEEHRVTCQNCRRRFVNVPATSGSEA